MYGATARGLGTAVVAVGALLAGTVTAAPIVEIEEHIELRVRPMTAAAAEPESLPLVLRPTADVPADGILVVRWPGPDDRTEVRIRARERLVAADDLRSVVIEAEVHPPAGARTHAQRVIAFDDADSVLFEVHRAHETGLTLAIECQTVREVRATTRRTFGSAVSFRLDVHWIDGTEAVLLETNRLDTFVGDSVSYAFSLDEPAGARSMEVRIAPLRMVGGVLQVEMEVDGTLPGDGTPRLVARRERWLSSPGATSSLDVVEGEPAKGYRFSVTPSFDAP
jgi:hypothetical protein